MVVGVGAFGVGENVGVDGLGSGGSDVGCLCATIASFLVLILLLSSAVFSFDSGFTAASFVSSLPAITTQAAAKKQQK